MTEIIRELTTIKRTQSLVNKYQHEPVSKVQMAQKAIIEAIKENKGFDAMKKRAKRKKYIRGPKVGR